MAEETTQALAAYAASLDCDAIPEPARVHCKNLLLDALACAVAGHVGEETRQIAAFAGALAPGADTSVIGGNRSSLAGATILNGFLITALAMCDTHGTTQLHVTPLVVPPALAIAERDNLSGRNLLAALAAGFEVTTRVGTGLDFPTFRKKGFHHPGIIGPFGAAAAVGRLLGFDASTMARSFGLAGSQSAGTTAASGTPTVKFHQSHGALSGLMAALLAQQGFVANPDFLTRPKGGLYSTYSDGGHPERVTADLGQKWELQQVALRAWPAASPIQGMITALFDLLDQHELRAQDVQGVHIGLSPAAFELHGIYASYAGKFQAMQSAHYAAAAILHDRELSLRQFEPARYDAPELREFAAERIIVMADPTLTGAQATVAVSKFDGTTVTAGGMHTRGSPENPLTTAQVEDKFRQYAAPRLSAIQMDGVIQAVEQLEQLGSVRELMDMLRCAPF